MKYEDLQYSESEKKSQGFTEVLFSSQTFLKRLLSSPCLLLLSLGLSLLLASVCVMGYQNFKFQSDLQTLRTGFSNFTSNTAAEVQALNSQGGNLQEMITSLKAEVESHKQELQAARSLNDKVLSLENRLEKQLEELKAGQAPTAFYLGMRHGLVEQKLHPEHCTHCPSVCIPSDSEMLLRVQQLAKTLNSLTCKMDALKSNCKSFSQNTACCPANWLEHEGRCYWFSSLGKPWPEAEKDCQLKNAHLVVINSREEQDFIQANLRPYFTCMGLSDPDGVWKWVDGSDYETDIKNWKPGQPDDVHRHELGGGEDSAHFYPDGKWNDGACQRLYHWICEAGLSKGN
ncbi:C-type lectin domain family 10 member A-like [Dama dama]|uniref:C-type lectin domain family 10 member A-like n=1 Tax=Dama dama TaxID=30532 RepID=UPI002A36F5CE|nr:C-type lectin domain family 10 member A-like [Dama dama]